MLQKLALSLRETSGNEGIPRGGTGYSDLEVGGGGLQTRQHVSAWVRAELEEQGLVTVVVASVAWVSLYRTSLEALHALTQFAQQPCE